MTTLPKQTTKALLGVANALHEAGHNVETINDTLRALVPVFGEMMALERRINRLERQARTAAQVREPR